MGDWLGSPKKRRIDLNKKVSTGYREVKKCSNRPAYRKGRKETSVRVYTVNDESKYVLVYNIPAINVLQELKQELECFGRVKEFTVIEDKEVEHFTQVVKVEFQEISQAKETKKEIGKKPFFGQLLVVEYAPEYETVQETQMKLETRKQQILAAFKTPHA